jgi:hypothetical protein
MNAGALRFLIFLFSAGLTLSNCTTSPVQQRSPDQIECNSENSREPANSNLCAQLLDKEVVPMYGPNRPYNEEMVRAEFERRFQSVYTESRFDNEAEYLRFIRYSTYYQRVNKVPAPMIYGLEAYKSWRRADSILRQIPIGKLDITIDLLKKIHETANLGLSPGLKQFASFLPAGWIPNKGGVFKKRWNVGVDPLFHPLNEEQYKAIISNRWLDGPRFLEVKGFSRPGARRGFIIYTKPENIEGRLQDLISWYNRNKVEMNPVELAANFQRRFVSIHPFVDGNGRTSRLFMDRILLEMGLPPPIFEYPNRDLYMYEERWVKEVERGIVKFLELATIHKSPPLRTADGYGARKLPIDRIVDGKKLILKETTFELGADGFFYNPLGIPHIFHELKLYPVADSTYVLYSMYGRPRPPKSDYTRALNHAWRDLFRTHFHLLNDIQNGKIMAEQIEVSPYSAIEEANQDGRLFLYEWQKSLLREALTIEDTEAKYILAPYLSKPGKNHYERFIELDMKSPNHILAQYESVDLRLWEYEQYARREAPEYADDIRKTRIKAHKAARELIVEVIPKLPSAKESENAIKQNHFYKIFMDFFSRSKISFDSFDEAVQRLGDDTVYLLRSDNAMARYTGFLSQENYRNIYDSIPGSAKITELISEFRTNISRASRLKSKSKFLENLPIIIEKIKNKEGYYHLLPAEIVTILKALNNDHYSLDTLVAALCNKILGDPYKAQGVLSEYQRLYVDLVLHAEGSAPVKVGTSFTSNAILLANPTRQSITFTKNELGGAIFLVGIPKKNVIFNSAGFLSEYEFITLGPVSPFAIVRRYSAEEIKASVEIKKTEESVDYLNSLAK